MHAESAPLHLSCSLQAAGLMRTTARLSFQICTKTAGIQEYKDPGTMARI